MGDRPKFIPKPGQIDYTHVRWAPVVNCVVKHNDKILIVKRSKDLKFYPGLWNGTGGFLDDKKSLEEKVKEELEEETGITEGDITSIRMGTIFHVDDPELQKTWIMHPVLVEVTTDKITLDWEAEEYKWITKEETDQYDIIPSFLRVLDILFPKG